MQNAVKYLSGKKTYVVSFVTVVYGVLNLVQGHHWAQIIPYLLAGGFGGAIRAAVAKVEAKLPASVDSVVNSVVPKA